MRRIALLFGVLMVCIASLAASAVAFGDDDGGHHSGNCEYEHGYWHCDD